MKPSALFNTVHDALVSRISRSVKHSAATLVATPPEQWDYKPTETAKSVRELAQHIVLGNNYSLQALGVEVQGNPELSESSDLIADVEKTGAALIAFVTGCDEEALVSPVEFFGHPISTFQMLLIAEWHLSRHAGQVDFLQTAWNDMEDRF
jgi:hypothetical protein